MVASFILVAGILAALGLIANSMRHSIDSRDEVIAAGLAQEGAELVRNMRDNNFINSPTEPFKGFSTNGDTCFDMNTITTEDPSPSCSPPNFRLYYNTGKYTHSGTGISKFSRKITIAGSASDKTITSKVWWGATEPSLLSCSTATKCVSVQSTLTEWQ